MPTIGGISKTTNSNMDEIYETPLIVGVTNIPKEKEHTIFTVSTLLPKPAQSLASMLCEDRIFADNLLKRNTAKIFIASSVLYILPHFWCHLYFLWFE
jgi:hypothetical protein